MLDVWTSCNAFFKSGVSFNTKVVPIDICCSLEAAIEAVLQNRCSTNLLNIIEKRLWRPATLLKLKSFTGVLQGFC